MKKTQEQAKELMNKATPGLADAELGDRVINLENRTGEAVADAAGATPTAAEFNALLDSLRNAGLLKV